MTEQSPTSPDAWLRLQTAGSLHDQKVLGCCMMLLFIAHRGRMEFARSQAVSRWLVHCCPDASSDEASRLGLFSWCTVYPIPRGPRIKGRTPWPQSNLRSFRSGGSRMPEVLRETQHTTWEDMAQDGSVVERRDMIPKMAQHEVVQRPQHEASIPPGQGAPLEPSSEMVWVVL